MKKILFICTGNTCRSAMAQAIFRKTIRQMGLSKEYKVSGAGLMATDGRPMNPNAVEALSHLKIRAGVHKAKRFSLDMVKKYDYIITMTAAHKAAIGNFANVFTFGELCESGDIDDPYGGNVATYLNTARIIDSFAKSVMEKITQL